MGTALADKVARGGLWVLPRARRVVLFLTCNPFFVGGGEGSAFEARLLAPRLGGWRLTGPLHVHLFAGDPRQRHDVLAPNRARRVEEDAARDRVRKIQNELAVVGFDLSHTGIMLLSYNSDGNTTEQGAHDR